MIPDQKYAWMRILKKHENTLWKGNIEKMNAVPVKVHDSW